MAHQSGDWVGDRFRVAQWLGPIPIGWILLLLVRGRQLSEALAGVDHGSTS